MKFEQLEKIRALLDTAEKLEFLFPKYQQAIRDPRCDKHDLRFGGDARFTVFTASVYLTCYTGYHGNSSCSTFNFVNSPDAQRFLEGVLNANMEMILREMAALARAEAGTLKAQAQLEIANASALLAELTDMNPEAA